MKLIKLIILVQIFLLSSCNEQSNLTSEYGDPLNNIPFDFEKDIKESDELFNLIDSIGVVKLETNNDCLIGGINKILYDEDYLYVLDENGSKSLFKFTKSGEFVLKISNIGRGPGEFIRPSDFFLLSDKIVLLDGYAAKVMFFTKDGDFLDEFSTQSMGESFGKIDTNYFCMFNESQTSVFSSHNVLIVDKKGNAINKLMGIAPYAENKHIGLYKRTEYFGEELLYTEVFSHNIFRVQKDTVSIKYHFDFGKNSLDEAFLNDNQELTAGELILALIKENVVRNIDYFNENSKYLYFLCSKKTGVFFVYYDKEEQKPYIFQNSSFPEWYRNIATPYIYSNSNMFVSVFSTAAIGVIKENYMDDISENEIFSKLSTVINQAEMSDNPVLITYYFK